MSDEERTATMTTNREISVKDERESSGRVTVTVGAKSDGANSVVTQDLIEAGITNWPGRVFRK
jgi:hypothetical protein